jgi:hypothetical protein
MRATERSEFRRFAIDVEIQSGLGRFFAAKFRSAVLYRLHEQTGDRTALEECLKCYRAARGAWVGIAERAKSVYVPDITVGERPQLRGHWRDRVPAMDADIEAIAKRRGTATQGAPEERMARAIREALGHPRRGIMAYHHAAPARFRPGQPLEIELSLDRKPASVWLFYRHVNQAERYKSMEMPPHEDRYRAVIAATYTDSPYPLQYFFEVKESAASATLCPGLGAELTGQPYFVVRRA